MQSSTFSIKQVTLLLYQIIFIIIINWKVNSNKAEITSSHNNNNNLIQQLVSREYSHLLNSPLQQNGKDNDYQKLLAQAMIPSYLQDFISTTCLKDFTTIFNKPGAFENINQECLNHTSEWLIQLTNLTNVQTWALQMIDAWGKIPEGILSGHVNVFGDFDECVGVRGSDAYSEFRGRYCDVWIIPMIPDQNATEFVRSGGHTKQAVSPPELLEMMIKSIETPIPAIPSIGSCFPSSCSKENVQQLLVGGSQRVGSLIYPFIMECSTDQKPPLNAGSIAMIVVLAILSLLCIVGTFIDIWSRRNQDENNSTEPKSKHLRRLGFLVQCVIAFSIYTNTLKWLNTSSSGDNLGCIHGIRFLSTAWVVLGHTWVMVMFQKVWNIYDLKQIYRNGLPTYAILNGTPSVDTFFTLSAILFSYTLLKTLAKSKGSLNIPMLYLHRYLRLTPTYALLIGIMATIFPYFGSGPSWFQIDILARHCVKNWWHNLLYINNLIDYGPDYFADGMCQPESWYLSNDMQFFIISPFIIWLIHKWERIGLSVLGALLLACTLAPAVITYKYGLIATFMPTRTQAELDEYNLRIYDEPWTRAGPYLVGLFTGYLLYRASKSPPRISKLIALLGWTISTISGLLIIFGVSRYFDPNEQTPRVGAAFYATHRTFWGVVISWVIYACVQGYGGVVNRFLSWKVFIPLGRLTFCVYLTSYHLQMLLHLQMRQVVTFNSYTATNYFFAHMVMSLLVGFFCCITMESPFIILDKLLLGKIAGASNSNNKNKQKSVKP